MYAGSGELSTLLAGTHNFEGVAKCSSTGRNPIGRSSRGSPRLAPTGGGVLVRHGTGVETRPQWFAEAVWAGEFDDGDFDQTDIVFGSGARLRDGRATFVSSASTVDRLQWLEVGDRRYVSNSLPCLLAVGGVKVVPHYLGYPDLFRTIIQGVDKYERIVPTQSGVLRLCYFRNLIWDSGEMRETDKPQVMRDFSTFEGYRGFLSTSLAAVTRNMRAPQRMQRFELISALSSGYDSTTAAVLGRECGMGPAFSFRTARGGEPDHGQAVADALGLELAFVERTAWRTEGAAEIPYLAASALGPDVLFSSAKQYLQDRVLLTGFHGDKVWGKDTVALGADIVRGDASGLSFTEHRLALGCIHLPVPFLGVRQIRDVHRLSHSDALKAWDVPGDYSRPVARRIVEDAGVPREAFGIRKKAATNLFRQGEARLTDESLRLYHAWLRVNRQHWTDAGLPPPDAPGGMYLAAAKRLYLLGRVRRALQRIMPAGVAQGMADAETRLQRRVTRRLNMIDHVFPWAVAAAGAQYADKA